jgi:hypothetical protein
VVALSVMAIKWIVPSISKDLRERMRREAYVTNEIIIRTELLKAKGKLFNHIDDLNNDDDDDYASCEPNSEVYWTESNMDHECTSSLRQRQSDTSNLETGDVTDGKIVI